MHNFITANENVINTYRSMTFIFAGIISGSNLLCCRDNYIVIIASREKATSIIIHILAVAHMQSTALTIITLGASLFEQGFITLFLCLAMLKMKVVPRSIDETLPKCYRSHSGRCWPLHAHLVQNLR